MMFNFCLSSFVIIVLFISVGHNSLITTVKAEYVCNNKEQTISEEVDPVDAFNLCFFNQIWESWPCFNLQDYIYFPNLPDGLTNPLPGLFAALLYLKGQRETLTTNNFRAAYDESNVPQPEDKDESSCDYTIRDHLGRCNTDGSDIMEGAAGTAFARNTDRTTTQDLLEPNPHTISLSFFSRKGEYKMADTLNVLAVGWIQFMIHDWFNHDVVENGQPLRCPLGFDHGDDDIPDIIDFDEFEVYPTYVAEDTNGEKFVNTETHWWDASQLYGKKTLSRNLRKKGNKKNQYECELDMQNNGNLPVNNQGQEITGFTTNWWSGLSIFHTLFSKEHNYICEQLANNYPELTNDERFIKARLIISAQLAKLHTLEWTTALLNNPVMDVAMMINWYGSDAFQGFPFNVPPLKGSPRDPLPFFALTEEFVSVYRMHSLLPDYYDLRTVSNVSDVTKIPLRDIIGENVSELNDRYGQDDLIVSYGIQKSGSLTLNNYPKDLQNFIMAKKTTNQVITDLAMVDVLRDRERGVPRYNEFRRQVSLKPIKEFEDLTSNEDEINLLQEIYSNDVEAIDLMVGLHAEECRPDGFAISETALSIFLLMASKRISADSFYTDKWTPEIYTQWGLNHVENESFKSTILRHYPQLVNHNDFTIPDNAYQPWTMSS